MDSNAGGYKTIDITSDADALTRLLYNTPPGRALLGLFVRVCVSKLAGTILSSRASTILIKRFIRNCGIDMSEYKKTPYRSFNEFFVREIEQGRRPFPNDTRELAAPCDGKLTAYDITPDGVFNIKNSRYDIAGLLNDKKLADEFMGGYCLIFRLTPDDYHRYRFIDNGEILSHRKIKGILHTVRPIAFDRHKVFIQNAREYTVMQTENFGKMIHLEVGAMFVGKICNGKTTGKFSRGEEKGYFEFGGSTIITLFQKDKVRINDTIRNNTMANKETVVRLGNKVGIAAL